MSFCENVSELYRELRTAAGTVLSIVSSRLEADSRARVDEVGPQWLTEFEDEICDEADRCEYAELTPEVALGICPTWPCTPACHSTSAAVSAAADPSPAVRSPSPASVGGEGPGGASDIPQSAPPGQPTCAWCNRPESDDPACCADGRDWRRRWEQARSKPSPVPAVVAGGSPREEDEQPSLGEPVSHEDLAAHITAELISGVEGEIEWLTQCFIEGISTTLAKSVMSGFNVFTK